MRRERRRGPRWPVLAGSPGSQPVSVAGGRGRPGGRSPLLTSRSRSPDPSSSRRPRRPPRVGRPAGTRATIAPAAPPRHFELTASFLPARKADASASVAVTFQPLDPDVKVNETPAPRLALED